MTESPLIESFVLRNCTLKYFFVKMLIFQKASPDILCRNINFTSDVDECQMGTDNCDIASACYNTPGSFRCVLKQCPRGQRLDHQIGQCTQVVCERGMRLDHAGTCAGNRWNRMETFIWSLLVCRSVHLRGRTSVIGQVNLKQIVSLYFYFIFKNRHQWMRWKIIYLSAASGVSQYNRIL